MKKQLLSILWLVIILSACQESSKYELKKEKSGGYDYEYVTNDPLNTRIYTLKNGLKVYLSRYDAAPRVFTQIAVRAGGKNDPATATGLAHYLEHILFKGSDEFGTSDWSKEKIMLDSIEQMYEKYRTLTDSMERVNYYKRIDQYSGEAAKLAIANEYDKMIQEFGGRGTNAYTTEDRTVYINDVPANQLDNWLQIEASRFRTIVPRLFHTELEAVYEEKNRGLDNDYWKAYEALFEATFEKHPYGTQTVIGTIDHLKNPSITEIKKYFDTYYKPNNVAICLSGDLDYDKTIAMVDKYFSGWEPNPNLPTWTSAQEDPIMAPIEREVFGPDAEWIYLGYRFPGRNTRDYQLLRLTDMLLANSQAGLIDINLKKQQKVLDPGSFIAEINDYSIHLFNGRPREGQSLDQVRDLLISQIELLKKGEFEDWLMEAVINDLQKRRIQRFEDNTARSDEFVTAFTNNIPWEKFIAELDELRKFTKEDVMKFANENYGNNYVYIKKRNGQDPNTMRVVKPAITKVDLNKEARSPFHEKILSNPVEKLQPVFLDYKKDIQKLTMDKGVEVLYSQNKENELFTLYYLLDAGTDNDPKLDPAVEYLQYLGTDSLSAEDIAKKLYRYGCEFSVFASPDQTYISLTGLSANMEQGMKVMEDLLANAVGDDDALAKMIDGTFKTRDGIKKDKWSILFQGLMNFGLYGPESSATNVVTNKELRELKPEELLSRTKDFTKLKHRVLYYGPKTDTELLSVLNAEHQVNAELKDVPPAKVFDIMDVKKPSVFWTDYDMVQTEIMFLVKGEEFNKDRMAESRLYNEYMGNQVFRELREAQGLAYSTFTHYATASKKRDHDYFYGYIGSQADKQVEAMKGLENIIYSMPQTEDGFMEARDAVMSVLESERINKTGILFNYLTAEKRGLDYDVRKDVYEQIKNLTLADINNFQQQNIKKKKYNVVLVGSKSKINFNNLKQFGDVKQVSLDELFGYEKPIRIDVERPNR